MSLQYKGTNLPAKVWFGFDNFMIMESPYFCALMFNSRQSPTIVWNEDKVHPSYNKTAYKHIGSIYRKYVTNNWWSNQFLDISAKPLPFTTSSKKPDCLEMVRNAHESLFHNGYVLKISDYLDTPYEFMGTQLQWMTNTRQITLFNSPANPLSEKFREIKVHCVKHNYLHHYSTETRVEKLQNMLQNMINNFECVHIQDGVVLNLNQCDVYTNNKLAIFGPTNKTDCNTRVLVDAKTALRAIGIRFDDMVINLDTIVRYSSHIQQEPKQKVTTVTTTKKAPTKTDVKKTTKRTPVSKKPAVTPTVATQAPAADVVLKSDTIIKCWSCNKTTTVGSISRNDGDCPHCGCEIDLSDPKLNEKMIVKPVAPTISTPTNPPVVDKILVQQATANSIPLSDQTNLIELFCHMCENLNEYFWSNSINGSYNKIVQVQLTYTGHSYEINVKFDAVGQWLKLAKGAGLIRIVRT